MTAAERRERAKKAAEELVQSLRASNGEAEKRGAPHVAEKEYETLRRQLVRKLVRTA